MTENGPEDGDDGDDGDGGDNGDGGRADARTVVRYGAGDGSLASTIVEAVAEATDADPVTVGPLNDALDTDALERLFSPLRDPAAGPRTGTVAFRFEGCRVVIHADGRVVVRRSDDGDDGGN